MTQEIIFRESPKPQDTIDTLFATFLAADALTEARVAVARLQCEEARATDDLDELRRAVEFRAVTNAGGEKGLGTNEGAQKRALGVALDECGEYRDARCALQELTLERRLAEAEAERARNRYEALLAALGGDPFRPVAYAWIEDDGARCGVPVEVEVTA